MRWSQPVPLATACIGIHREAFQTAARFGRAVGAGHGTRGASGKTNTSENDQGLSLSRNRS